MDSFIEGERAVNDVTLLSIDRLDLTGRARNCLIGENILNVGDLVRKTATDLLGAPGLGRGCLHEIKTVLSELGLSLNMSEDDIDAARHRTPRPPLVIADAETFKEELVQVISRLLAGRSANLKCFLAYHGLEDGKTRTLEEVGREGIGFERQVSRSRVGQVINNVHRTLWKKKSEVRFCRWAPATKHVRDSLPMPVHSFLSSLGFDEVTTATELFSHIGQCARILGLDFPFEIQRGYVAAVTRGDSI